MRCNDGHFEEWTNCEWISAGKHKLPILNLKVICYSLLGGLHWEQVHSFFSKCGIPLVSSATYYRYLKNLIYPVIYDHWLRNQADALKDLLRAQKNKGEGVKIAGDGRFDSPGWSAKYCTYIIQALKTNKIICFMVASKQQVNSSAAMEVFALKSLLTFLISCGLNIVTLVTDRSSSVRGMMQSEFSFINHQFDPWHLVKNIKNNLIKVSKLASCAILKPWIKSIVNMLWWSLDTSKGDPDVARHKIMSILNHTSGIHHFAELTLFPECAHRESVNNKPWLPFIGYVKDKLRTIIFGRDGKNLADLKHYTECCQTSEIESFNSLILKYSNKTYSYGWLGMYIRTCIAALDWNSNTERAQKVNSKGELMYRIKVNRFGIRTVVPVKVEKSYHWQDSIFQSCVSAFEAEDIPHHEYPVGDDSVQLSEEFNKQEAISKLQCRIGKISEE